MSIVKSQILARLSKLKQLPTSSNAALRMIELVDAADCTESEIADAIAIDPAVSARILRFANWPLMGKNFEITSIGKAVLSLGMRAVKTAALSFSLVENAIPSKCPAFEFRLFWEHAAATAVATRELVEDSEAVRKDEGLVADLLSRAGKLALATVVPGEYQSVLMAAGSVARCGVAEERDALGIDHVEAGAALLTQWGLPSKLVRAVEFQSAPEEATDLDGRCLAEAIRRGQCVADVLCGIARGNSGVAGDRLERIKRQFGEMASIMRAPFAEMPGPVQIENRARRSRQELFL